MKYLWWESFEVQPVSLQLLTKYLLLIINIRNSIWILAKRYYNILGRQSVYCMLMNTGLLKTFLWNPYPAQKVCSSFSFEILVESAARFKWHLLIRLFLNDWEFKHTGIFLSMNLTLIKGLGLAYFGHTSFGKLYIYIFLMFRTKFLAAY